MYDDEMATQAEKFLENFSVSELWNWIKGQGNQGILQSIQDILKPNQGKKWDYETIDNYTAVIPELNKIHKGNILLFKVNKERQTAVIVETGTQDRQTSTYENIKAVYLSSKNNIKAGLKSWSELKEIADDGYIEARQLLLYETEADEDDTAYSWDLYDITPSYTGINIGTMRETDQVSPEKYRWIPNTGEYLELSDIHVVVRTKKGIELAGDRFTVRLTGAEDRDYDAEKGADTYGNIYNNKATSFEVKIGDTSTTMSKEGQTYTLRVPEGSSFNQFTIGADNVLFSGTGKAKIKIRPVSAEKAYPGDDLLLQFIVTEKNKQPENQPVLTVGNEDYIAVYDKKMMWRANLYLENTDEHELSDIDWNNAHPWDAPADAKDTDVPDWWNGTTTGIAQETIPASERWGYNEWNRVYDSNPASFTTLEKLAAGEGGQVIDICSWTRFNGGSETNSVAYSWGCWDSVFDFNFELQGQKSAIETKRESDTKYAALSWNGTTTQVEAPDGDWNNYIFPELKKDGYGLIQINPYLTDEIPQSDQRKYTVSTNAPSVPGFSSWVNDDSRDMYSTYDENNTFRVSNSWFYSSGIDCSGLASISAQYTGRIYKISDWKEGKNINAVMLAGKQWNNETGKYEDRTDVNYSYAIYDTLKTGVNWLLGNTVDDFDDTDEEQMKSKEQWELQRELITHAVPGDILVSPTHVVLIQNLNYPDDTMLITDFAQIDVIHSTSGIRKESLTYMVRKNTWENVQTDVTEYQLRRLAIKEN